MELRFIDSFKFVTYLLEALVKNLTDEQLREFKYQLNNSRLCQNFGINMDKEELYKLLRQIGMFPYEYIDSLVKLE